MTNGHTLYLGLYILVPASWTVREESYIWQGCPFCKPMCISSRPVVARCTSPPPPPLAYSQTEQSLSKWSSADTAPDDFLVSQPRKLCRKFAGLKCSSWPIDFATGGTRSNIYTYIPIAPRVVWYIDVYQYQVQLYVVFNFRSTKEEYRMRRRGTMLAYVISAYKG